MQRSPSGAALICASVAICLLLSVARAEEPLRPAGESNAFRLQSVLGRDVRNTDGDSGGQRSEKDFHDHFFAPSRAFQFFGSSILRLVGGPCT